MTRPLRARIHPDALHHNLERVRAQAPRSRVLAVVKADAYGHGLAAAAGALCGADGFGVLSLEEAAGLRRLGVTKPIWLLEGFFEPAELDEAAALGVALCLHHPEQVAQLADARARPLKLWLKLDTGMHRLGLAPERLPAVLERLRGLTGVVVEGVMSHLANADDPEDPTTPEQLRRLHAAVDRARWAGPLSLANSAGVMAWPQTHLDWVRPGIMLYGSSPVAGRSAAQLDLRPAMTLESRLIAVNPLRRGDRVGYGGTFTCPEDMPVGVVACGYGDGYPRHAPNGTPVQVGGVRVALAGRVSMDMITVDLRPVPHARPGDPVVLWGPGLPVDEVAAAAGTIAYELLTGVTRRVPRESAGG